ANKFTISCPPQGPHSTATEFLLRLETFSAAAILLSGTLRTRARLLTILIVIDAGSFDECIDVVVEVRILQSKFRGAIVIEQANRRVVFDRLLEVVDGDVITEDLAGAFFADDQRGA